MDKVIKLNSKQGGSFTETANLVDFDVPNNGVYDLSRSYINLLTKIDDPGFESAPSTSNNTKWNYGDQSNTKNPFNKYAKKFSEISRDKIVTRPNIAWKQSNVPIYNVTMVKNCSISSELQGSLEDIRRIDCLRQNLNQYTLTEDQKKSLEYSSLNQRAGVDLQSRSVFRELHQDDQESRSLIPRIPIKLSQLFEVGQIQKYPGAKMGKTRIHLELNLDKLEAFYPISAFQWYGASFSQASSEYRRRLGNNDEGSFVIAPSSIAMNAPTQQSVSVASGQYSYKESGFPFYNGQLVRVNLKTVSKAQAGANVAGYYKTVGAANAINDFKPDLDGHNGLSVTVTTDTNAFTDPMFCAVEGIYAGVSYIETFQVTQIASTATISTGSQPFHKVTRIRMLDADGNPTANVQQIQVGVGGFDKGTTENNQLGFIVFSTFAIIASTEMNDNGVRTINFADQLGDLRPTGFDASGGTYSDYETAWIDTLGTYPVKTVYDVARITGYEEIEGSISLPMAELVMHQLGRPGKTPNKINYRSWSTEQFSTSDNNGIKNFQRMYQLEPEASSFLIMFPNAQTDDLTASNDLGIQNYRLRLNNEDLINRNIELKSPLYYDRLNMTFVNMGYRVRNLNERALFWNAPPQNNQTSGGRVPQKFHNLCMLSNPVPVTPNEKMLQVNINSINGLTSAILYKLNARSI